MFMLLQNIKEEFSEKEANGFIYTERQKDLIQMIKTMNM